MEYVSVCMCSFSDISCISGAVSLSELALDGNPMSHELSYKQTVLRHVTQIRQLDMKRVTVRVVCSLCMQIYANVCKRSDLVFGPNSTWLVTSRQDTTRHVRHVEPMHFGLCRACRTTRLDTLDTTSSTGSTRDLQLS